MSGVAACAFYNSGTCRKGAKCKFSHQGPPASSSSTPTSGTKSPKTTSTPGSNGKKTNKKATTPNSGPGKSLFRRFTAGNNNPGSGPVGIDKSANGGKGAWWRRFPTSESLDPEATEYAAYREALARCTDKLAMHHRAAVEWKLAGFRLDAVPACIRATLGQLLDMEHDRRSDSDADASFETLSAQMTNLALHDDDKGRLLSPAASATAASQADFIVRCLNLLDSYCTWDTDVLGTSVVLSFTKEAKSMLQFDTLNIQELMIGLYLRCTLNSFDELSLFFEQSNLHDATARIILTALRTVERDAGISVAILRLYGNPMLRDGAAGAIGTLIAEAARPPQELHLSHCEIGYKGLSQLYASVRVAIDRGVYPAAVLDKPVGKEAPDSEGFVGGVDVQPVVFAPLWLRVEWNSVQSHLLRRARAQHFEELGECLCGGLIELGPSEKCRPISCKAKSSTQSTAIHLIDFESIGMGFQSLHNAVNPLADSSTASVRAVAYSFLDTNAVIRLQSSGYFQKFAKNPPPSLRLVVPHTVRIELDKLVHQTGLGYSIRSGIKLFLKGQNDPNSDVGRLIRRQALLFLSADSEKLALHIGSSPQSNDEVIIALSRQWRRQLRLSSNPDVVVPDRCEVILVTDDAFCREQARSSEFVPACSSADFARTLPSSPNVDHFDFHQLVDMLKGLGAFNVDRHRVILDVPPEQLDIATFARDVQRMMEKLRTAGSGPSTETVESSGASAAIQAVLAEFDTVWASSVEDMLALS